MKGLLSLAATTLIVAALAFFITLFYNQPLNELKSGDRMQAFLDQRDSKLTAFNAPYTFETVSNKSCPRPSAD